MESPESFERGVRVQLEKEIWGVNGCAEFLQKLNFELSRTEPHSPWVTLSAPAVKLDRKMLHFAVTAISAVFGKATNLKLSCFLLFNMYG